MRRTLFALTLVAALSASAAASPPAPVAAQIDPSASRISGAESYVPTFGLRASIARGFGLHGILAVDAGLDIPDTKDRKRAQALRPRILNALRDSVLNYASQSYIVGERPDADMLHARMQKTVDGILGPGAAKVALASVIIFDR